MPTPYREGFFGGRYLGAAYVLRVRLKALVEDKKCSAILKAVENKLFWHIRRSMSINRGAGSLAGWRVWTHVAYGRFPRAKTSPASSR
jgi:hypothetical protein